MKKLWSFLVLLIFPRICFAQVIAVNDFTANDASIASQMGGITDVFRTALSQNNMAILSKNANTSDYVITGRVTRLGRFEKEETPAQEPAWLLPMIAGGLKVGFSYAYRRIWKRNDVKKK